MTVPVPVSLPPAVSLWVDGVRFADGQPAEPDTAPVALTGLTVTWGRSTTVDQPSPASCAVTVLDVGGGVRFADVLHLGARVVVRADAVIYPDPTVPILADPGFEAAAVGSWVSTLADNADPVTVSAARAHTGVHAARVFPLDAARGVRVVFPPAPLSGSQDPTAWDAVPRVLPGQSWGFGAAVRLPAYPAPVAAAVIRPAYFTRPWGPAVIPPGVLAAPAAPVGGWVTYAGTVVPPADVWVGVCLDVYPTGPAWDDVPPALTWDQVDPAITWDDLAAVYVDDLAVLAPAAGAARAGVVFAGRITDLDARYDTDVGGVLVDVTAQDDSAELGNRPAGDVPWLAEALSARFAHIVTASGQPTAYTIAPAVAAAVVSWRDVDAQPALTLLQSLATSVGGALWAAASLQTGQFLFLEDISSRPALFRLVRGADLVIRIAVNPNAGAVTVSACDVQLDPIRWELDTTDDATRVDVTWRDQTLDDKGQPAPTDRTVTVVNAAAEAATGRRRVSVSTELTTAAAAQGVGDALLGRLSAGGWRISGLTWRAEPDDPLTPAGLAAVMQVLDGVTRLGLPILLVDLPDWTPIPATDQVPLYLEGGRMSNTDGAWTLELLTSSARAQGAAPLAWDQVPAAWLWDQFDPAITWNDLRGVGL